ncbi:MAG: transposase [Chloroflexi bacterium]|nr:transposase [Chloroflexota bacterium]
MVRHDSLLIALVQLVDAIPLPPPPPARRGHPRVYSDRLFLKALVIMIVRHLATVGALLAVLEQPTSEMQRLRSLLTERGRYPCRRTWERRLNAIPATLPAQIGCLGRHLVELIRPWEHCGRAAALDSTLLRSRGGVWHKKHREAGVVPHTSIDTQAHWTKSGWHGWVYGWKLHVAAVVASVWIPLAAELTPANVADNEQAPALVRELPPEVRYLLGDTHYNDPALRELCEGTGRELVTTRRGKYPHTDGGAEVRRIFHKLRSLAMENFNQHFKGIFGAHGSVPTKGLRNTQRFALGAILVYQVALLYRHEHGLDLTVGLKPFLQAA